MKELKVIIAGGRDFSFVNYKEIMKPTLDKFREALLEKEINITIVSGKAQGADYYGELYAKDYNLKVDSYPADWNKHGKAAGPIRNGEMAQVCDTAIIFWDGKSRGTKNMIDQMKKVNKPFTVKKY